MAGEVLSQEEVERLLSMMYSIPQSNEDYEKEREKMKDSGVLSRDELNALFGGACPTPAIPKSDTVLNQDEIENRLGRGKAIPMPDESNKKRPPIDEVFSQTEVKNLLNMACPINKPKLEERDEKEDTVERIDKKQLKTLQFMHEKLARIFAAKVSAMLQSVVDVRLTSIEQLSYSEFVFSCDNPTCFNLIQAKSPHGDGHIFLDINRSICFPMIERMLGSRGLITTSARRPLTRIETRLVQQVIDIFLKELKTTWQKVIELEFTIEQTESNPLFIHVTEPNEEVVVLCFAVSFIEIRGAIMLCIPVDVLEQIYDVNQSGHEDVVMEVFRNSCDNKK